MVVATLLRKSGSTPPRAYLQLIRRFRRGVHRHAPFEAPSLLPNHVERRHEHQVERCLDA